MRGDSFPIEVIRLSSGLCLCLSLCELDGEVDIFYAENVFDDEANFNLCEYLLGEIAFNFIF